MMKLKKKSKKDSIGKKLKYRIKKKKKLFNIVIKPDPTSQP